MHSVGHSERSGAVVEPYLSTQWFVKMQPLADEAIELQKAEEKVNFVPDRFEKTYLHWMENIRDWCISRQLWWGHRIPAWYHNETGEVYVGKEAPADIENWKQDNDVLGYLVQFSFMAIFNDGLARYKTQKISNVIIQQMLL